MCMRNCGRTVRTKVDKVVWVCKFVCDNREIRSVFNTFTWEIGEIHTALDSRTKLEKKGKWVFGGYFHAFTRKRDAVAYSGDGNWGLIFKAVIPARTEIVNGFTMDHWKEIKSIATKKLKLIKQVN